LPYKIGYDLSGTVVAMGKEVKRLKEGDVVFCCLPFKDGGSFDLLSGIAN
jgi:NADPH:quinone reductase-like Zn-dependent oxidoreductase